AYLCSGARDESYCVNFTIPTASTWTRVKIQNIPPIPTAGTWTYGEGTTGMYIGVVMACGSQWVTANKGQWNSGMFLAGTGQSNMVAVTNNQMKITAMRLEASPQAGYASINSFDTDYWECIRYYFTNFNYQSTSAGSFGLTLISGIAGAATGSMIFPRRMAKVPTIVLYSASST